jgi:hypothetical protein
MRSQSRVLRPTRHVLLLERRKVLWHRHVIDLSGDTVGFHSTRMLLLLLLILWFHRDSQFLYFVLNDSFRGSVGVLGVCARARA